MNDLNAEIEWIVGDIYESCVLNREALAALAYRVRKATLAELLRSAKLIEAAMGSQPAMGAGVVRVAIESELDAMENNSKCEERPA